MLERRWTRREVIGAGCAALAVPAIVPRHVPGFGEYPGAGESVRIAIIGLGGRANGVWGEIRLLPGLQLVGVADCFAPRVHAFLKKWGQGERATKGYVDFRTMIEKERPDGVMIETTTHARAWITITAMQMGCDVYIEKPMSLTISEGRFMVEAARSLERVTQVGTQQRSMAVNNRASDLVKSGALGKVHTVVAPNFVGPEKWEPRPAAPLPQEGGKGWWNVWTNQAPMRPYHPQIHHGWVKWTDYDGGGECFGVTGWGTHSYDQVNRGLGTDTTGPTEIRLEEEVAISNTGKFTRKRGREDTGVDYHAMAKPVVGPRARVTMRFGCGAELKCHLDGDEGPGLGAIFIGEKGRIELNRGRVAAEPAEILTEASTRQPPGERGTTPHVLNWLDCIRSRKRCSADIEIGQRSSTLCHLVNIVREMGRVGERLLWDPERERFENSEEANELLQRERRAQWELPSIS